MKRIYNLFVAALAIAACGNEGEELASGSLSIDFSSDRESARVGETVTFTAIVSGGTAPYTYAWDFGDGITSDEESPEIIYEEPGVKMISLDVTDADGNKAARPRTRTFVVEAASVEDVGDIEIAWYVDFGDAGGGVRGSVPAVDDQGNVYITTSVNSAGQVRKVSSDGKLLNSMAINDAPGNTCTSV